MNDLKQSIQALTHSSTGKTSTINQKNAPKTRQLVVLRTQAAYKECLHHCKSLGIHPVKTIKTMNAILLHAHPHADMGPLKRNGLVRRVESDRKIKLHTVKKKARRLATGCASIDTPEIIPWGIARIQAPLVWKATQGSPIRVAILDTGIAKHPDLRVVRSFNTINKKPVIDRNGHGTHVAGTVAALRNSFGVVGVAPKAKLYAVQSFNSEGSAFTSDIIQGIDWCIRNRMQVINMSFGLTDFSPSLQQIIRKAHRQGIVMIASAGNSGKNSGTIDYPARFPETIAVAASTENNQIAVYSSRGAGIDVTAPGDEVCSTYLNNSYTKLSGTSMAAPHVTGTVALLLSRCPRLSPTAVKQRLQRTARKLNGFTRKSQGNGLINASRAVLLTK
ncbi:peptidase S8 [Paenibacillus psychroresistens]|uniref:Peptidase S8 n=1 Tax=Paenibacillus psychroresistens TaxID=1778678 RepID=A0A6B8RJS0_9BACL|nr:S8 family peptidase [Paenibacillus psychroresistens]QGQ95974.1 peptidase S8 [Paenibacillus psychroresistens]